MTNIKDIKTLKELKEKEEEVMAEYKAAMEYDHLSYSYPAHQMDAIKERRTELLAQLNK